MTTPNYWRPVIRDGVLLFLVCVVILAITFAIVQAISHAMGVA